MKKELFTNYIDFLNVAYENKDKIKSFKFIDNRLLKFNTPSKNCEFVFDNGVLTPNKFVESLGFKGYTAFTNKRFSKLKDFAKNEIDAQKWYAGFFGGLVGTNRDIVNNYVGNGEVFDFFDYDINKAYLYQLTDFLPTKFVCEMTHEDFLKLNEVDKIPYFYFFEIEIEKIQSNFLCCVGKIKSIYQSFDFLNSKQDNKMIVSEKRLSLINQIYFKTYIIKKVFVFQRERFKFYENILQSYLIEKSKHGAEFKTNALRLYGTFGQIYKYKPLKLLFDKKKVLSVNYNREINWRASPQVSMWVADCVATKLFDIISTNLDKVICWNTDGLTAIQKMPLQVSNLPGKWKVKKIKGLAFLFNDTGARLFLKDIGKNQIFLANNVIEKNGNFFEEFVFSKSQVGKGYVQTQKFFKIDKNMKFDEMNTLRNQILKRNFIEKISREYEEF